MNFLLFFISSAFAAIFYIFYTIDLWQKVYLWWQEHFIWIKSISWNLYIEAIIFLLIGFFMFFLFSNFSFFWSKEAIQEENQQWFIEKESLLESFDISVFIKKYLYYIGFILFYLSIFLILKSLWISDFNICILILNIIIWILFFITNKAELFRDFIKINTILFSLYYIILYSYILFFNNIETAVIDTVNTFFILSFFVITLYLDSKILKRKESDNALVLYFFLYIFIICTYYIKEFFNYPWKDFLYAVVIMGMIFNFFIYFFLQKVQFLQNSKYVLRALSLLFIYIATFFWIFVLIKSTHWIDFKNTVVFSILLYSVFFNYYIHHNFQNYISYSVSLLTGIFLVYFTVFTLCSNNNVYFLKWQIIITFFFSFSAIVVTYLYSLRYRDDYFFLHFCAFFVNFLWIIYYFYFADFMILTFWIVLLLDSILVFWSYFKLKKLNS